MDRKFLLWVVVGGMIMFMFGFMKGRHDRQARMAPARMFRGGMGS